MHQLNVKHGLLWVGWISVSVFIILLSVYGRSIQQFVISSFSYTTIAWALGLTMLIAQCLLLYSLSKSKIQLPWLHLTWFLPMFLLLPLLLERVEERLHFLAFGTFGIITILLFKPRLAFMVCILGSSADELLQLYLPDRVGDLRDVVINSLASLGAAYFIFVSKQINKSHK